MERLLHPVLESCDLLGGMSRSTLYAKIKSGEIAAIKVGRSTYIAHRELVRYVGTLTGPAPDRPEASIPASPRGAA